MHSSGPFVSLLTSGCHGQLYPLWLPSEASEIASSSKLNWSENGTQIATGHAHRLPRFSAPFGFSIDRSRYFYALMSKFVAGSLAAKFQFNFGL